MFWHELWYVKVDHNSEVFDYNVQFNNLVDGVELIKLVEVVVFISSNSSK